MATHLIGTDWLILFYFLKTKDFSEFSTIYVYFVLKGSRLLTKLGLKKICQDNDEESWKGPIVVFGVAFDGEDHPTYVNVTPEDFSRVVDAGLLFGAPASQEQLEKIRKGFMNLRL